MKTTAKKLPAAPVPLIERTHALIADVLAAPPGQRQEVLEAWRDALDQALDDLAEARRPTGEHGIPVGWIRNQLDIRGGHCHCKAMLEAMKAS